MVTYICRSRATDFGPQHEFEVAVKHIADYEPRLAKSRLVNLNGLIYIIHPSIILNSSIMADTEEKKNVQTEEPVSDMMNNYCSVYGTR